MAEEKDKPKIGTKVTYIDQDQCAPEVQMHGVTFKDGEAVDLKEHFKDNPEKAQEIAESMTGNRYFEVEGGPKRERPKKAAPAKKADDDDDDDGKGARLEHGPGPRGGPAPRR